MTEYVAIGKREGFNSKDIYTEFEADDNSHAKQHIIDNFDREYTWLFTKKLTNHRYYPNTMTLLAQIMPEVFEKAEW